VPPFRGAHFLPQSNRETGALKPSYSVAKSDGLIDALGDFFDMAGCLSETNVKEQ
jgi:hypothetical protein